METCPIPSEGETLTVRQHIDRKNQRLELEIIPSEKERDHEGL